MKKVLRFISVILMGVLCAAMFLFWQPLFNGQSISQYALELDLVKYVIGGLLVFSGLFSFRSVGFKNRRITRILVGAVVIGVTVAVKVVPGKQIPVGPAYIELTYLISGGGLVVACFLLFGMHFSEIFSRRGLAKIFAPLVDLVFMVFIFALYAKLIVPQIDQISFYQYVELALQYGHYACGGLLAVEFLFSFLELFVRKAPKIV